MKKGRDHLTGTAKSLNRGLGLPLPSLSPDACCSFTHSQHNWQHPFLNKAQGALHGAPHVLVGQESLSLGRMQTPDLFLWFSGTSGKSTGFGSKQPWTPGPAPPHHLLATCSRPCVPQAQDGHTISIAEVWGGSVMYTVPGTELGAWWDLMSLPPKFNLGEPAPLSSCETRDSL